MCRTLQPPASPPSAHCGRATAACLGAGLVAQLVPRRGKGKVGCAISGRCTGCCAREERVRSAPPPTLVTGSHLVSWQQAACPRAGPAGRNGATLGHTVATEVCEGRGGSSAETETLLLLVGSTSLENLLGETGRCQSSPSPVCWWSDRSICLYSQQTPWF